MMHNYIKGYKDDAAVDIIMTKDGEILPGFSKITLPVKYTPHPGEVAVVCPRTSTSNKGIFVSMSLIDANYIGKINVWIFNASGKIINYKAGDRLFSVVNLQLAPTRVDHNVKKSGSRRYNKIGSTGGGLI